MVDFACFLSGCRNNLIVAILFFPFVSLSSAPIGNPSAPSLLQEGFFIPDTSWSNLQMSFTEDLLLQKRMKTENGTANAVSKASIQGSAQIGQIAWNIRERFNLEIELGSGKVQWNWIEQGTVIQGQSDNGFIWSGSAKLVILEVKDTSLAGDGQIGGWDKLKGNVCLNSVPESGKARVGLRYWQAGVALTQKISLFAPYIGCMVNQTTFRVTQIPAGSARLQSLIVAGPFLGCTLSNGSKFSLNIEWRGWFEQGLALSGQVRF